MSYKTRAQMAVSARITREYIEALKLERDQFLKALVAIAKERNPTVKIAEDVLKNRLKWQL